MKDYEAGAAYNRAMALAEAAKIRDFAEGVTHGFETALRLFLGEAADGGAPCPQPLPPEAERWARDALARLTEQTT